jgi:dihydrofolate synthase/folylpolyglutamate synthase
VNDELRFLDSLQGSGIRPGLDRMRALLRAAGRPERSAPTVIVAGTNGKGSTAATLVSILESSGYRTGFYSSPHLVSIFERWQIGGANVDESTFSDAVREMRGAIERAGFLPTYFEALTFLAFLIFRRAACEVSVLEVGMGGRLDATNVTRPLAALITAVGIDHVEYLGHTLRSIAREKAGVIHRGTVALTSNVDEKVLAVIRRRAAVFDVPLHLTSRDSEVSASRLADSGTELTLRTPHRSFRLVSPLAGAHQIENIVLAVRGAEELAARLDRINVPAIEKGVAETRWRGRLERFLVDDRTIFVDGAHNAHAVRRILPFIEALPQPRLLVFGVMGDKDVEELTESLFPCFQRIILTRPNSDRAADPERLASLAARSAAAVEIFERPEEAFRRALAAPERTALIAGSLYLAGSAVEFLDRLQ